MSAVIQLHPRPIIPVILVKVDPMLLSPCPPLTFYATLFSLAFFYILFSSCQT